MTVCFTIQRPPHVHFFRNAISTLESAGIETHVFVRASEITTTLLDAYNLDYAVLADSPSGSIVTLASAQLRFEAQLIRRLRDIQPDVVTGIGGVSAAHGATAVGARSIVFTDTEHARLSNALMRPFADLIVTPSCFHTDYGSGHIRYPGYHELAYLHPDRFDPDPEVLERSDIDPDRPLAVVRLGAWDAAHDIGAKGINDPIDVVRTLEAAGAQVRVTAENGGSEALAERSLDLPPDSFHDVLAQATFYLGEGATTAAECAILGTPAVYINSLRMGYTDELEARYGLLYNCQGSHRRQNALRIATKLLDGGDLERFDRRRERLLQDKVDTTDVILRVLESGGDRR